MSGRDERSADADAERALQQLFARAAPRVRPPERDTEEIRGTVFAEWNRVVGGRIRRRRALQAAAAATVAAVVLGALLHYSSPPPLVARVERLEGGAQRDGESGVGTLRMGAELDAGDTVTTGDGQVALTLATGGSLRIAAHSSIELDGDREVRLTAGALYFDSEGERDGRGPFAVVTRFGVLHDVGTQFMTRVDSMHLEVGVRDGRVTFSQGEERADAERGERLTIAAGEPVRRDAIATYGPEWAWAERLAPRFDIDGRHVGEFLSWVGAQTGRKIEYVDAAAEQSAQTTTLTGSIDLEPLPKLAAVLALTDLDYAIDGDRIVIRTAAH